MIQKNHTADDVFSRMTDIEKAFYAKFKLAQRNRMERKRLLTVLESKGLTKTRIEEIVSTNSFKADYPKDACTRCGSFKIYLHKADGKKNAPHCLVCGYVESTKEKSRFTILKFLFGG